MCWIDVTVEVMSVVPDSISEGLLVLFVGFNPSPASTAAGHPYAHRSNRFYKELSDFLNILRATGYHPPTTED